MNGLVGAIIALKREAYPFLEKINYSQSKGIFSGNYNDTQFRVIISGYGKVMAASATQRLIDSCPDISHVIHFGTGGGLDDSLKIGDLVIPTQIIEYDVLASFDQHPERHIVKPNEYYSRLLRESFQCRVGIAVSGDQDVDNLELRKKLRENYNALIADWESFAVAKVCELNNIPCAVIRTVSDNADDSAAEFFEKNCHQVSIDLANKILEFYSCR
jgi:adenosylhomocysteine nucleosidase